MHGAKNCNTQNGEVYNQFIVIKSSKKTLFKKIVRNLESTQGNGISNILVQIKIHC